MSGTWTTFEHVLNNLYRRAHCEKTPVGMALSARRAAAQALYVPIHTRVAAMEGVGTQKTKHFQPHDRAVRVLLRDVVFTDDGIARVRSRLRVRGAQADRSTSSESSYAQNNKNHQNHHQQHQYVQKTPPSPPPSSSSSQSSSSCKSCSCRVRPIDADDPSSGSSTPSLCYQSCEEELEVSSLDEKLRRVTTRIAALHDIAAFKLKMELARSTSI